MNEEKNEPVEINVGQICVLILHNYGRKNFKKYQKRNIVYVCVRKNRDGKYEQRRECEEGEKKVVYMGKRGRGKE